MPVRIRSQGSHTTSLALTLPGAARTQVELPPHPVDRIVPLLPITSSGGRVAWSAEGQTLQALGTELRELRPDQRLVGMLASEPSIAGRLFPGHQIITIRLEADVLADGDPAAWELLDALVVDAALLHRLQPEQQLAFLACGLKLAVIGQNQPQGELTWKRLGSAWVSNHDSIGPRIAAANPTVFAPVQGWSAQRPVFYRRRILLFSAVVSILLLGTTLLPHRWTIPLAVTVCGAAILANLTLRRSPLDIREGTVLVTTDGMDQEDRWAFATTMAPTDFEFPLSGLTHPFFELETRPEDLTLRCPAEGPMHLKFNIAPAQKLAFRSRRLSPSPARSIVAPGSDSPMVRLARRAYLRPGYSIAGQIPDEYPDGWPAIMLRRDNTPARDAGPNE